jgi:ABC-type polysaccharide/polyol phosphate transport system ATPase subunit
MVSVERLGKRFKIYTSPWHRAGEWLSGGRRNLHSDFWALREISFSVAPGECFGIIGPNGSGKSTLLKLLSGVLVPSKGRFEMAATTVYSLLELGTGFHDDLTGRQNVHQSARLLGLPAGEPRPEVVEQIREFADVGDFFDRPLRFYSSGMRVRLGFALFAHLKPQLLIVDEALSVGDVFFQQKCAARIDEMRAAGVSFLFVSHDMEAIRRLCRQALVLNHGRATFLGPSEEAVNRYYGLLAGQDPTRRAPVLEDRDADEQPGMEPAEVLRGTVLRADGPRHGQRGLEILAARLTDARGRDTRSLRVKDVLHVDLLILAHRAVEAPTAGLALYDRFGTMVYSAGTGQHRHRLPALAPGDAIVVRLELRLSVQPGEYTFMLGTSEPGVFHDWHEQVGPLEVASGSDAPPFYGVAELPMECRHGGVRQWGLGSDTPGDPGSIREPRTQASGLVPGRPERD